MKPTWTVLEIRSLTRENWRAVRTSDDSADQEPPDAACSMARMPKPRPRPSPMSIALFSTPVATPRYRVFSLIIKMMSSDKASVLEELIDHARDYSHCFAARSARTKIPASSTS